MSKGNIYNCVWPSECANSERCSKAGMCIARWQSANKDKLFPSSTSGDKPMTKYWMIHPDLYNVDKDGRVFVPIQIEPDKYHDYEADPEYVQVEIPPMAKI